MDPIIIGSIANYGQPNRPVGGSSHSFITALTILITTGRKEKLQFTRGHSHDEALGYARNNYDEFNNKSREPVKYSVPDLVRPIVWVTRFKGNPAQDENRWEYLEKAYPNFKFINISFTRKDVFTLGAYHFLKMHRFNYINNNPNKRIVDGYLEEAEKGTIRKGLTNFNELTLPEIKVLLNRNDSDPALYEEIVNERANPPIEFSNRIHEIKFYDIHHDKNKVLATLSVVTGKEITPVVIESYDDYLAAQIPINEEISKLIYPK